MLCLLTSGLAYGQHFEKPGKGVAVKSFYHPQGLDFYLSETDDKGNIYHLYYDTVTSGFNYGKELIRIRLQIFDGKSWLFSKPITLFTRKDVLAPRVLDMQWYNNALYLCGSFDSSENNLGGGVICFKDRNWTSNNLQLYKQNNLQIQVNKLYAFNNRLLITGDFDSIPGNRCNGITYYNGSNWTTIGSNNNSGFNGTTNLNSTYFEVVNDSLYVYKKNAISNDTIGIGGKKIDRLGVLRDNTFEQLTPTVGRVSHLIAFNNSLAAVELSPLFYARYISVNNGNTWQRYNLTDSFYAINFISSTMANGYMYFTIQNPNQLTLDIYRFDGSNIIKQPSWKIASNYIAINAAKTNNALVLSGNFRKISGTNYYDSCRYIAKLVFSPATVITGTVFHDNNSDGIKQSGETALTGAIVTVNNNQYLCMSDAEGHFTMVVPSGINLTVKAVHPSGYVYTGSITISPGKDSVYNLSIGLTEPNKNDLSVGIFCSTGNKAKQGFTVNYTIDLHNKNTMAENCNVIVQIPKGHTTLTALDFSIQSQTKQSFTFNTTVSPHSSGLFHFSCIYPVDSFILGQNIFLNAKLQRTDDDNNNNTDTIYQRIVSAYDPNIKVASPSEIIARNTSVRYTIYYQNEGNDTAINVTILDTLGDKIDASSIRINQSKGFSIENNILIWRLENIMLPPKEASPIKSAGFVSFTINLSANAKVGDTIFNKAAIYFDYQKPVITNFASVYYKSKSGLLNLKKYNLFKVYPNPAQSYFKYENGNGITGPLQITDASGKIILETTLSADGIVQLPESMATGIYFIRTGNDGEIMGKLIVTR